MCLKPPPSSVGIIRDIGSRQTTWSGRTTEMFVPLINFMKNILIWI